MLTHNCRDLLTAYVDGELTARQHRAVLRLLQRSADARDLLRQMQRDSEALRQLPIPRLERDLAAPVVRIIAERRLRPGSRRRIVERPQPNFAAWAGFSAAAAALLLVALGSYLYFSMSLQGGAERDSVAKGKAEPARQPVPEPAPPPAPDLRTNPQPAVAVKKPDPELVPTPAIAEAPGSNKTPDAIAAPSDPIAGMEMFKVAPVTQLQVVKLTDLDQEPRRKQLLTDLAKQPAFRMESPVKDSIKAFDRLKAALTARGIGLVIDGTAQSRMTSSARLAKIKTNFVLYVEDITPEELVQLFRDAAGEDRRAEKVKKGDTQLEALVINTMADADREELCKLLGVKGKKLPDPPTGPLGVDIRKPISEKTGDDITKSLTGQGGLPRPESGKITGKPPERLALVMPYNPVRPRPDSPEVKRFLASRKPPRAGTMQVLLVLRELGA
jgi:hypothetical protein